jgi:DNA-binding NtrC family response regulator
VEQGLKQHIILVDDETELLELYQVRLKSLKCTITTFSKPQDFIDYMQANPTFCPDLVITDFMMPGMTGIEMIHMSIHPQREFPSILLSGYIDKEKAIEAANSGVWNILEKPVEKEQLLSLSRKLLLESRIKKLGKEIRSVTAQLTELFAAFRILCMDELDLESMKKPVVVSSPTDPDAKAKSLEDSLAVLETRLRYLSHEESEIIKQAA